jgi:hypothetical protein
VSRDTCLAKGSSFDKDVHRTTVEGKCTVSQLVGQSGLLLAVIVVTALGCCVVFRRLGMQYDAPSVALATSGVALALIPPLWFEMWRGLGVAAPLATVAWRLGILLPIILYTSYQFEPSRNCVQVTLLACYLMTLPLESWLLIRQSRQ